MIYYVNCLKDDMIYQYYLMVPVTAEINSMSIYYVAVECLLTNNFHIYCFYLYWMNHFSFSQLVGGIRIWDRCQLIRKLLFITMLYLVATTRSCLRICHKVEQSFLFSGLDIWKNNSVHMTHSTKYKIPDKIPQTLSHNA